MAQLVRHHARDFVIGPRGLQHPPIEEHRSPEARTRWSRAGSRRRTCSGTRDAGRRGHQPSFDALHDGLGRTVIQHRDLLANVGGRLPSELNVLLGRAAVPPQLNRCLRGDRAAEQHGRNHERGKIVRGIWESCRGEVQWRAGADSQDSATFRGSAVAVIVRGGPAAPVPPARKRASCHAPPRRCPFSQGAEHRAAKQWQNRAPNGTTRDSKAQKDSVEHRSHCRGDPLGTEGRGFESLRPDHLALQVNHLA